MDLATREKFCKAYGTTLAQLLAWEAQGDFMQMVLGDNTHFITKRPVIVEALLKRGSDPADKQQMLYAAAFLIVIGDPTGETLAKIAAS
jgi:hypothetical protein